MCAITDRTAEGNISKSLVSIVTALWTTISSAQKWMDGMGWTDAHMDGILVLKIDIISN